MDKELNNDVTGLDLIEKCQITLNNQIKVDTPFLKQLTTLGFKIVAFDPTVIECDSFPAENQVSKLFDVLSIRYNNQQKTKSPKQASLTDISIKAPIGSSSCNSNVESDDELEIQQDESEATTGTWILSLSTDPPAGINQLLESNEGNKEKTDTEGQTIHELEESFKNFNLNSARDHNQKYTEKYDSCHSIDTKSSCHSSNTLDVDDEKLKSNSIHFHGSLKFTSDSFIQEQIENAMKDEDTLNVQENVSSAAVFDPTKTSPSEDSNSNSSNSDDDADDFKNDDKENSRCSGQEFKNLSEVSKTTKKRNNSSDLLSDAELEKSKNNSLEDPVPENEALETSSQKPNRAQDNVTSNEGNSDDDYASDEDVITLFPIKKDMFEAAKFYFRDTPYFSLLNNVEEIDSTHELKIESNNDEAKHFLLKIKDLKKVEMEIDENYDRILSYLQKNYMNIKTMKQSATIMVILGPSAEVRAAHKAVMSLIENKDHEAFRSSKFEVHSKDSLTKEHLEETEQFKCDSFTQQTKSRDFSILVAELPENTGPNFNVNSQHGDARGKDSSVDLSEGHHDAQTKQYATSQAYSKTSPDENREQRHSSELKTDEAVYIDSFGIKVYVYSANITKLHVDCIVNAANSYLEHIGGVSAVIAKAAGPALVQQCEQFIKDGNVVAVTDTFVSSGGHLCVKKVLHAVGPRWWDYQPDEKQKCIEDLKRVVLRCLIEASVLKMRSIALPSISSAIFHVPQQSCAESYVNAVKSFNLIAKEFSLSSLKEIHFVDINIQMVSTIKNYFLQNKDKDITFPVLKEDLAFARKHLERNREERNIGIMESLFSSLHVYNLESYEGGNSSKVKEHRDYKIGEVNLRISTKHALDFNTDLVITVGEPFDKLSGDMPFETRKSKIKSQSKQINFLFCERKEKPPIFLCELAVSVLSDENIAAALKNLNSAISCYPNLVQSLVVTSKFLYPEKSWKPDSKFITIFSQFVYDYIKKATTDSVIKNVIVTASEEAFSSIIQVIDVLEGSRNTVDKGSSVDNVCSFCRKSVRNLQIFDCCKKNLCIDCIPEHRKCLVTQQASIATGNQPNGEMVVTHRPDLPVPGTSAMGVFLIEYIFPDGFQNSCHPDPGKSYRGCNFVAFLPATQEGFYALQLLRVAFLRRLTFTIGMTDDNNYTITQNGVHLYIYDNDNPYVDPKYPLNVLAQLMGKGVTIDNLTQEELDDWERLKQQMFYKPTHI